MITWPHHRSGTETADHGDDETISRDEAALALDRVTGSVREQITYTGYDVPFGSPTYLTEYFTGLALNSGICATA